MTESTARKTSLYKPLSSPLKYPGGKAYLASKIVPLLPSHIHFVEPYAGSLAVLLAKNPDGISEVVNDLNLDLSIFWQVLQSKNTFEQFQRLCEATPFSEIEWDRSRLEFDEWPTHCEEASDRVVRAWRFFILVRQSLAGRQDSFAPLSRTRTRRGMNEQTSAWLSAIDGLPEVHARLRRVAILHRPALEVIRSQDGPNTCYYLDPPYIHSTRTTTTEYGQQEMSETDHRELLQTLAGIQGKFVLSGYNNPLYEAVALSYGWKRVDFELPNNAAGGKKKRRMVESVWLRG